MQKILYNDIRRSFVSPQFGKGGLNAHSTQDLSYKLSIQELLWHTICMHCKIKENLRDVMRTDEQLLAFNR